MVRYQECLIYTYEYEDDCINTEETCSCEDVSFLEPQILILD